MADSVVKDDSVDDSVVVEVSSGDDKKESTETKEAVNTTKKKKKKKRKVIFQYGNYNRYYGYRVGNTLEEDPRVRLMRRSWFENKDVLDVGCNEGHVTISLVQKYRVRSMCGVDIDPGLIHKAWKNLEQEAGVTGGKTVKNLYHWKDYVYEDDTDGFGYEDEDLEISADATIDDTMELGGLQGVELLKRVIFKNANILQCDLRSNIVDTVLWLFPVALILPGTFGLSAV